MSAYSWENTAQECRICHIDVFPYELNELQVRHTDGDWDTPAKQHLSNLCGKCKQLGRCCVNRYAPRHAAIPFF